MASRKFHFHHGRHGTVLMIRVTAHASRNGITETQPDGSLCVSLTSAVENNSALVAFLSDTLSVAPSQIELVAGEGGAEKLVSILDVDKEEIQRLIDNAWNRR